jgi:hypothetical protein
MSRETDLKNFLRKAKTRKRLGLETETSIGPTGASIVSDDGKRLKNTSGDPNKKLKTLQQLADSLDTPLPEAGVASAIRRFQQGKTKKSELTEEQIKNILKEAEQKKDIKGSPHQGVKTDQEGNPILSIAKGGMVKKKTKKKKSKMAGRLAKRGYGAARK